MSIGVSSGRMMLLPKLVQTMESWYLPLTDYISGNGSRNNLNDYNRMSTGSLFRKRIKASSYSQSCASHTWRTFFVPHVYIESKTNSCYSQEITHTINTPFLLIEIRMNVQIKCRCYVWVTEYDADSFIITLAFNTSGRKCVPKSMKDQVGNIQSF